MSSLIDMLHAVSSWECALCIYLLYSHMYLVNENDISLLIFSNSQQNIDVSDINNDDTDDSDRSSESKKEESEQEQQVERLVLEEHPPGTHNSSEPDASNETPLNASSLVEESSQKNEDVVEAEIKIKGVASSASNHYLNVSVHTKGACLTLPGSQSRPCGQQPATDCKKRVHTKGKVCAKNRPCVKESSYPLEVRQGQNTSCVQCSDVDMPPLLKPNIIIPKINSE